MSKLLYVYRSNRVIKIKDGITLDTLKESGYFIKHPDTVVCSSNPPTAATMERWENDGYCKAIDGCRVEPDGTCPHNKPSWLIALGLI
jgi:hypothetical protein